MLKGDLRKKQILETAERLFCEYGYEKTSVQDILDVLKLSKGSFYHHFESKELVLRSICDQRARAGAGTLLGNESLPDGAAGIDHVLSAMIPFHGEGLQFVRMILPVFLLDEGRSVRYSYRESLCEAYLPALLDRMEVAAQSHVIFVTNPEDTARICLSLTNELWSRVSDAIIGSLSAGREIQMGPMITLADAYRRAIEEILSAPFGSMQLIRMADLHSLCDTIRTQWTPVPSEGGAGQEKEEKS